MDAAQAILLSLSSELLQGGFPLIVLFAFGATPMRPREVYELSVPANASGPDSAVEASDEGPLCTLLLPPRELYKCMASSLDPQSRPNSFHDIPPEAALAVPWSLPQSHTTGMTRELKHEVLRLHQYFVLLKPQIQTDSVRGAWCIPPRLKTCCFLLILS